MGLFPIGIVETVKCLVLTQILFLGPLFEAGIVDGEWNDWIRLKGIYRLWDDWTSWRNYVAVRRQDTNIFYYFSFSYLPQSNICSSI